MRIYRSTTGRAEPQHYINPTNTNKHTLGTGILTEQSSTEAEYFKTIWQNVIYDTAVTPYR